MQRLTKILAGMTFAAGILGASAAMAAVDSWGYTQPDTYSEYSQPGNYSNSYAPGERQMLTDRDSHAFIQPGTTYSYSPPSTYYYYRSETYTPSYGYAPSYNYAPSYSYTPYPGYYDNPYNPYWSYRGPLGQGSGSDMRFGR